MALSNLSTLRIYFSMLTCYTLIGVSALTAPNVKGNHIHHDLFIKGHYDTRVKPSDNEVGNLTVHIGLSLAQLIKIDEKNQIMTTRVWLRQEWSDSRLRWDPRDYGGLKKLQIPASDIWLPDIVLYNNADGDFAVTLFRKATVYHTGRIVWQPPAQYKSYCPIDVEFFPFDTQKCFMKFSVWSYDGTDVDIQHICKGQAVKQGKKLIIDKGIDLRNFEPNVEWDIVNVTAQRSERFYKCCPDNPYPDITFFVTIRRRTLFHTVNLIIPCIGISCLTVLVFYLPADSGEKITLSLSILMALAVFFLLLNDIIPPTSLVMPMIGKYLLFTMVVVIMSIQLTVVTLNINYRSPSAYQMSPWVRRVFTEILPRILCMRRPNNKKHRAVSTTSLDEPDPPQLNKLAHGSKDTRAADGTTTRRTSGTPYTTDVLEAVKGVKFIADHMSEEDTFVAEEREWEYIAKVIDRLFLYIFSIAVLTGSVGIFLHAPSLYDTRPPLVTENGSNTSCVY